MNDADRAALTDQYADAANLDARISLRETYEVADQDWWPWVFDHYDPLRADADVLEVGCGTGYLWRENADRLPDGWDLLEFSQNSTTRLRRWFSPVAHRCRRR